MSSDPIKKEITDLARRVGETMWAVDTASKDTMGMDLLECVWR
jgi:acyl-CoA thioesterase